jgi:uncharacterized repeat protein (TIGR03803 family)
MWCEKPSVLSAGSASMLVVLVILALAALVAPSAQAQTFAILHAFQVGVDGATPLYAGLILDAKGNLYGTTAEGGTGACDGGCGTVFKLEPTGKETVLYSFEAGGDGNGPYGSLIRDTDGNIYGTTSGGGTSGGACLGYGCGTVFMLDPAGKETVLYNFTGGVDGATPQAGLVRDAAGNLYGTTFMGGAYNWGTVFMVDQSGNETVLHSFDGSTGDGGDVPGGLISDSAGNLYGTTQGGGHSGCNPNIDIGCGTVYQISPSGTETVLFRFFYDGSGGQWPGDEHLFRDQAGNLYGTSQAGRRGAGWGAVFKLDPAENFTVLHNFAGGAGGGNPWEGVVGDAAGNLYGTTLEGGGTGCPPAGCGTVFKLGADGAFTVLHRFTGKDDGEMPWSLVWNEAGILYGITSAGGEYHGGTVFKIIP